MLRERRAVARQRLLAVWSTPDAQLLAHLVLGAVLIVAAAAVVGLALHAFLWSAGFRGW